MALWSDLTEDPLIARNALWPLGLMLLLSGCATGGFEISAADQDAAVERRHNAQSAQMEAEGLHGSFFPVRHGVGRCRWAWLKPSVAVCRTSYLTTSSRARVATKRYRRDSEGDWELVD